MTAAKEFVARALRVLGVSVSSIRLNDPELTRTMVAVTPLLRYQLLFPKKTVRGRRVEWRIGPERAPYFLLGTYLFAAMARSVGMETVTYQTLSRLLGKFAPLLWLLSYTDDIMVWKPGRVVPVPNPCNRVWQIRYVRIAKELLSKRQGSGGRTLEDIVCEHNNGDDSANNDARSI